MLVEASHLRRQEILMSHPTLNTPKEQKRYINRGRRFGMHFMQTSRPMRSVWSLGELYGRPTKWATIYRSREAGRRIDASMNRLRNELLDCISLSTTPILSALMKKDFS